jgi:hypothetical protein
MSLEIGLNVIAGLINFKSLILISMISQRTHACISHGVNRKPLHLVYQYL